MNDRQYLDEFISNIRKMIKEECSNVKTADTIETTVISVSPLKINIGGLEITSEFIKILNNVYLEVGDRVLVIRSKDKQSYYIMGVI